MIFVFDSSAVIAFLRREPSAEQLIDRFDGSAISAVNYAEVISHGVRSGIAPDEMRADLSGLQLIIHTFDEAAAAATGALIRQTKPLGLSLGDRACLALAKSLGATVITSDRAWGRLDLGIAMEFFR
jgi:PIN domain nuclease of toxin-antitoxin system